MELQGKTVASLGDSITEGHSLPSHHPNKGPDARPLL